MITDILVAAGTITLALIAYRSIRQTNRMLVEDRENRHIERTPIFGIKEYNLKVGPTTGLVNSLSVEIENIGYGPAFNVSLECSQGTGELEVSPVISGGDSYRMTAEIPFHLVVGEKGRWRCTLRASGKNVRTENVDKRFVVTVVGESMFRKTVKQQFVWIPNQVLGGMQSDALPLLLDVDFGIRETNQKGDTNPSRTVSSLSRGKQFPPLSARQFSPLLRLISLVHHCLPLDR